MMTHDEFLKAIQAAKPKDLELLDSYADWLQTNNDTKREEYVRLYAEYRRDPGRKMELIKNERRLKELREFLGDAWCDLVHGHTAVTDMSVSQCYGELLGRLDAFTTISQSTADQLDFAAELWTKSHATDDFLISYYAAVFETDTVELVQLKDWREHFRIRLGDWLMVCVDFRSARSRHSDGIDGDLLCDEFIRLVQAIAAPTTVSRVSAKIIDDDKPIPRAYLFEGTDYVLSLTLTVLD